MNEQLVGRIEFGPASDKAVAEHTAVGWPPYYVQSAPVEAVTEISRLRRELAAARKWYDAEFPAEEGRDQVYPWDHA